MTLQFREFLTRQFRALKMTNKHQNKFEKSDYIGFILGIVGIIQGFSLSHLYDRSHEIIYDGENLAIQGILGWIVCFFVLVRISQTFIAAALDRTADKNITIDLVFVFFIGLYEAYLVDVAGRYHYQNPYLAFYHFLAGLCIVSAVSHGAKFFSGKKKSSDINIGVDLMKLPFKRDHR